LIANDELKKYICLNDPFRDNLYGPQLMSTFICVVALYEFDMFPKNEKY
jgi:hypothetical protein